MTNILYITYYLCPHADPATEFYVTYPSSGHVRFESKEFPGTYLIIENQVLKCSTPSGGNDEFEIMEIVGETPSAYRLTSDCYIAFDDQGQVHGPCITGLSTNDTETHISLN